MSLQTQLAAFITRIGLEFKAHAAVDGELSGLTTTNKTNLVAAINELRNQIAASSSVSDDSSSVYTSYSSAKTDALLENLKLDILGGATSAYDTLKELQDLIVEDQGIAAGMTTAIGNRVRFDAASALSTSEMQTARTNIDAVGQSDLGITDFTDNTVFVNLFESSLL